MQGLGDVVVGRDQTAREEHRDQQIDHEKLISMKGIFLQSICQHRGDQNRKCCSGNGDQKRHTKRTDEQGRGENVFIGFQSRLLREKDEGARHVLRIACQGDRNDVPEGEQNDERQKNEQADVKNIKDPGT